MTIELRAGETVADKYRIERQLGRGAVGTVYAAEHVETGKRVALKCVDASHALDPASAERLVREAQAAARIRHAHVVDIYDVGRDGKLLFLVMEYLEGETLTCVMARRDLPVHKLISLLLPAMRGVAEAHRQGVVHRDIKPENIFIARQVDVGEPIAKVLDFGISKLDARGRALRSLTADGFAIGTPDYMAYEQAMGERTIDGRADVYAFGAILYEALTGQVPHSAEDFPGLVHHFVTQRVAPPTELGAKIPQSLSALVMWAIERDREQRVSSMESLIRELEPFASERSYVVERDPSASRPIVGKTLVGPWGMGPLHVRRAGSAAAKSQATLLVPSTAEAELWLRRTRKQNARKTVLLLAAAVLVLGLIGSALWPQPEQQPRAAVLPAPVEHSVSAAMRVAEGAPAPTMKLPSGVVEGAPAPAMKLPSGVVEGAPAPAMELPSGVAPDQALPLPDPEPLPKVAGDVVPTLAPEARPRVAVGAMLTLAPEAQLHQAAEARTKLPAAQLQQPRAVATPAKPLPAAAVPAPAAKLPTAPTKLSPKPASKPRDFGIY